MFKDCVMASTVRRGLEGAGPLDTALVIAGSGHLDYGLGVPERLAGVLGEEGGATIVTCRDEEQAGEGIVEVPSFPLPFPGHLVMVYREGEEVGEEEGECVKEEVVRAYNKVASTAGVQGDVALARRVMGRLGYTEEEVGHLLLPSSSSDISGRRGRGELPGGRVSPQGPAPPPGPAGP